MIKAYLRYRKALWGFFGCVLVFFPLVCYLYQLPREPVWYTLLIFSFLFLVWVVVDVLGFRRINRQLREVIAQPTVYAHRLPDAKHCLEEKYQEIIQQLHQLIQAQTAALNASHDEQVEYYTMWLHQIKTPIAAIRLSLQYDGGDPALLEQELFKIERYVEMALQFVKLQDLSTDLVLQSYDLGQIVHQSVKKYAPLFIYKKLSVEIQDIDLQVPTDSKWLAFILEQVLSNAIKYTNQGGIKIYTCGRRLVIADSGIGIRAEDLARVFEKGYTGYNGRLDQRASGIGLYMAKRVAQALGIELLITSQVGVGTRVGVVFPLRMETE